MEPAVDVEHLAGRGGEQSDSSATHALAIGSASFRSHPSGARSAHTSSNRSKPGMLLAAIVRMRPGGHEVHADALRSEVAGEVAGDRLERGLGHAHPVVDRPRLASLSKSRPTIEPPRSISGSAATASDFSEYADTWSATATSSHGASRKPPPRHDSGAKRDRVQHAVEPAADAPGERVEVLGDR